MYLVTLGFVLGNCLIQNLPTLPDLLSVSLLVLITLPFCIFALTRQFSLGLIVGVLLTLGSAHITLQSNIPAAWISKNLIIQGVIDDVVNNEAGIAHFTFKISQITSPDGLIDYTPRRVQLSIKTEKPLLHAGEKWQFLARLKPIHGTANVGSFDLEKWAFSQRLIARGYVVNTNSAIKLAQPQGIYLIQAWREKIAVAISQIKNLKEEDRRENFPLNRIQNESIAILQALTIGVKNDIPKPIWQDLSKTGTSHLVAISGLHIGLVAGMLGWLARKVWIQFPRAPLFFPAQKVAAVASLLGAVFYSALAGFSIPTQRTVVMVLVACLCVLGERPLLSWQTFCVGLLAVLIWDPMASLTIGFWLSFGAVGFILLATAGRLHQGSSWRSTLLTQRAVFVGLIPLSIYFFDGFSLISPIANAIAIPYVSIIVVPIALLGVVISGVSSPLALILWKIAAWTLQGLLYVLHFLAQFSYAYASFALPEYALLWVFSATLAAILLLTRAIPFWYLSFLAFIPLLVGKTEPIQPNEIKLTLLDVGQGLSGVIQTAHHVLLYDTGASFLNGGSFAESVVLPFFKKESIRKLDALVLSHADNDHAGGAPAILANMDSGIIYKNEEQYPHFPNEKAQLCENGLKWQWDGVDFEFLNPLAELTDSKRNDKSCVLRVSTGEYSILLPGDIERFAEKKLSLTDPQKIATTLLVAPHHGSRTSSSEDFIRVTSPQMILISAGYRNRYRLPSKLVTQRYEKWQIPYLETAKLGAIDIHLNQNHGIYLVTNYRALHEHYWTYRED